MKATIYGYRLYDGEYIYIGQTLRDPYDRYKDRMKPSNYYKNQLNQVLQDGFDDFDIVILDLVDKKDKNERERYWIKKHRPRFNIKVL